MFPAVLVIAIATVVIVYLMNNSGVQFDDSVLVEFADMNYNDKISNVAEGIAHAEGYGIPGAIPTIAHNPGDLVIPNWPGNRLGSEGISVFSPDGADAEGWNRLKHQLQIIIDGTSHVYTLDDTISVMANKWTSTQKPIWAGNLASYLGVTPDTTLREVLT